MPSFTDQTHILLTHCIITKQLYQISKMVLWLTFILKNVVVKWQINKGVLFLLLCALKFVIFYLHPYDSETSNQVFHP